MRSDTVHVPLGRHSLPEDSIVISAESETHAAHTQIILFLASVRQRGEWPTIAIQVFHRNLPCATLSIRR